ncbi:putative ribonuclease H-like domain-containing protein [Tanacetum coccineum]
MVPKIFLTRSGPISLKTARPVNTDQPRTAVNNAGPMKNVINNAYSTTRRPFNKITAANNSYFTKKVNTVKGTRVNTARPKAAISAIKGNKGNAVKASACWVWRPMHKVLDHGNPQQDLKDKGVIDSGCSRHMTGNRSYLTDYEEIDGGFVAFGGNSKGGKITGKGKIRTGKLDFEDVYFVKELKFNLFSVSQMCDKKNSVLFTDTECVVLSPDFKLTDESHVLLKVPRKDNMYSVDLKNVVPQGGLTCLFAKATPDESNLWHRRLGHVNFKTMNKLVKGNLVRGLPLKLFEINQTCVACQKGKQHRASCKTKTVSSISQPLQMLHMDLFGPTFVKSLMKKMYCLVVTDDFSRVMNQFCEMKGIKREFSVARTPQQKGVAERKNRTLIEAARTMLADSKLPTTFWAEAVNTACYVQNRVLVIKPHNKTPYELFLGYSTNIKAFRVFNNRTRILEENLHVKFSEDTPNIAGSEPNWLFDIDALTNSMNYKLVVAGNQSNDPPFSSSSKDSPYARFKPSGEEEKMDDEDPGNEDIKVTSTTELRVNQEKDTNVYRTNNIKTVSPTVNAAGIVDNAVAKNIVYGCSNDLNMPELEEIDRFSDAEDDISGADINNLDTYFQVSPVYTTRIHKDHPIKQIIGDLNSAPQTRRMTRNLEEYGFLNTTLKQRRDHKDIQNCLKSFYNSSYKKFGPWWSYLMEKELLGLNGVFRNKKHESGIVIKNKARLVAQGYIQEDGIDYDEFSTLVSKIEAIRLFLAYASFKDFMVYQRDVKSTFLYGKIEEEVYVCQPPSFEYPDFPKIVYKVEKALYGLHQAPRACSIGELTFFLGLQVKQKEDGTFISEDKYVNEILNKFGFSDVKTARTPMETQKALLKDEDGEDVDEHLYRSMISSLMYLTSSRPDIMFADSPFHLVAYTDSDYAGVSLDRKSTTGVKNPIFHSKIKHIEIRHHFIRDSNEKKLIQMIKIHTDQNVADLLTKAFDVSRFQYLIASIGMLKL